MGLLFAARDGDLTRIRALLDSGLFDFVPEGSECPWCGWDETDDSDCDHPHCIVVDGKHAPNKLYASALQQRKSPPSFTECPQFTSRTDYDAWVQGSAKSPPPFTECPQFTSRTDYDAWVRDCDAWVQDTATCVNPTIYRFDYAISEVTALSIAAKNGRDSVVRELLRRGASVNEPNASYFHSIPLHMAVDGGHASTVHLLLEAGARTATEDNEDTSTALHVAVGTDHLDVVRLLLQHGASINSTEKDMLTALHCAVLYDSPDMVQILLDHGATVDLREKNGFTALELAQKLKHPTSIKVCGRGLAKGNTVVGSPPCTLLFVMNLPT